MFKKFLRRTEFAKKTGRIAVFRLIRDLRRVQDVDGNLHFISARIPMSYQDGLMRCDDSLFTLPVIGVWNLEFEKYQKTL